MMGKKTVREIRAALRKACAESGVDLEKWLKQEVGAAGDMRTAEIETLKLIRDGLRNSSKPKNAAPRKRKATHK